MGVLVLRCALAVVLGVAAIAKLLDARGFRTTLRDFRVPRALAGPLAFLIPVAELAIAALLVPAATAEAAAWGALALLVAFSAAIGAALARGERPDCGCFGRIPSPVGRSSLVRNAGLGAAAVVVALAGPGESLDHAELSAEAAFGATVLLALGGLAWFSWQLFRQNGRLVARVAALEEARGQPEPAVAAGLPVGTPAPTFEVSTASGDHASLESLLARGRPVALAFSDPGCGSCEALLPKLRAAYADGACELEVALVTREAGPDYLRGLEGMSLTAVLLEADGEIGRAYGVTSVPGAVVVGANGRIASPAASGAEEVEALLARAPGKASLFKTIEVGA